MKRINHILALSLILLLSSCSQDDSTENDLLADDDGISFFAYMPGVSRQANYDLKNQFLPDSFTVSAISPEGAEGFLNTFFENKIVRREVDGAFRSDRCRWASNRGGNDGHLKFFAFHPSCAEMKTRAGVGNECFVYSNSSKKDASGVSYDYRLTKFRVAPDISNQVDFVSAIGEGNKTEHLYSNIELTFEHQLSGVEISAWGAASLYDIEVAGWRVGGIVVEADFGLSTEIANPGQNNNTIGEWFFPSDPLRGYVDYVFVPKDKVVRINAAEHNTPETAVSLLGGGGRALLIPQKQDMWDYKNNKTGTPKGMYFSALVRITQHVGDHHCIFPSNDPEAQDYIVFLSVSKADGIVMKRLDKNGNIFGTDIKYNIPDTEELRCYGWAAAPAKVDWKAGYTYHYVLNYTNGVGVHDPYDLNPASTIVNWGGVEITTTTGNWSSGGVIGGVNGSGGSSGSWGSYNNNTAPDGTVWWK